MTGGIRPVDFAWVALGGGLGSALRFGVSIAARGIAGAGPGTFPAATLFVNVAGCFAIGALSAQADRLTAGGWFFLATGVLGGFTTFSAFGLEAVELLRGGSPGIAALYASLSLALGLGAVHLGKTLV